ncbi:MAG: V-type ATPase subunit [Acholeplasma sp.]|nr:V-type ATPase subunit [Acholeplasma sp.]
MGFANNAIITKAKSIYGNFLKEEDYERIVKFRSIPDLVGFLKKHPNYQEALRDVSENSIHRGQLEALIKRNSFNQIERLTNQVFSKDEPFYRLSIVSQENELILSVLRTIISQEFEEMKGKIPYFFETHTKISVERLLKTTNFDELLDAVKQTPYFDILKKYYTKNPEMIRYLDIEHDLEAYYYDEAFLRIEKYYSGSLAKDLKSIFETRIELGNIIKVYRLKKFYQANAATIKSVLIKKHTRISEKKMDQIIAIDNPDAILKFLSKTEFSRFKSDQDYVYVEYYAEKIRYDLAKKFMYFSTEVPKVFLAFITLSEIEIENLTNTIEGIRYQVDENEIKQMLIY